MYTPTINIVLVAAAAAAAAVDNDDDCPFNHCFGGEDQLTTAYLSFSVD